MPKPIAYPFSFFYQKSDRFYIIQRGSQITIYAPLGMPEDEIVERANKEMGFEVLQ